MKLKPFSRAGLGLAPRRQEHERNLHQRSAIELKGVDNEDDDNDEDEEDEDEVKNHKNLDKDHGRK